MESFSWFSLCCYRIKSAMASIVALGAGWEKRQYLLRE